MIDYLFNSKKILARDRAPWVDYVKGICIILVCFRHSFGGFLNMDPKPSYFPEIEYLNIFFFSFRMPLFFMVSGIFLAPSLKRLKIDGYVKQRFQTIFYPLIIWGSIHITLQLFFAQYVTAQRHPLDYFRLLYQPRAIEQFWYLNALFFVGILYASLTHYAKFNAFHQLCLGLFLYLVGAFLHMNAIEIGFITDVLFFYIFFAVGDTLSSFMLNPANFKLIASPKLLFTVLPVFLLLQHYFTRLNLDHNDDYYVQMNQPLLFAVAALIGGGFITILSFVLQKNDWLRFLRVIGYHSLYIYVANLMVTSSVRVVLTKVFHLENLLLLLTIGTLAGIVIPMLVYAIANKAGAWWLYTLRKPEKKPAMVVVNDGNELKLVNKLSNP